MVRSFTPVDTHSKPGNGGCRTIYDTSGTYVPYGYDLSNRARGETHRALAERALDAGALSRTNTIAFARTSLFMPLDNVLFQAAGAAGVFHLQEDLRDGVEQPQAPNGSEQGQPGERPTSAGS